MEKYYLKIKILGLRNLKSLGLLPVKRPFIKFDINSLKPRAQKQALKEKQFIQTQPKETGSDPNLSTMIQIEVDLPKNYLLSPSLNCVVFDCIMKGLSQPVLGVFSINLSDFIKQGRERNARKLRKASQALLNKTLGVGGLNMFLRPQAESISAGPNILEGGQPQPQLPGIFSGGQPKAGGLGALGFGGQQPALGALGSGSQQPALGGLGTTQPALGGLGTTQPALGTLGTSQPSLGSLGLTQPKVEEQKSVVSPGDIVIDGSKGKKEGYVGLQEEKSGVIDLEKKDPMTISLEVPYINWRISVD